MGELIEGIWHRSGVDAALSQGVLQRSPSIFRNWITSDGSAPRGARVFEAERDRYQPLKDGYRMEGHLGIEGAFSKSPG